MRPRSLLLVAATAACASGGAPAPGPSGPITQSIGVAGTSDRMTISSGGAAPTIHAVNATPDRVWRVMPAVFDSLGVPLTRVDPAQRVIGNDGFKVRQRLRNVPLSRFLDCGQTQIGPNADSYEVFITLLVQVRPTQDAVTASSLVTTFEASARPLTFSQGYSRCSTRGALEARLLEAVRAQLR
jgi:hypothetical protein